jgi:2,4-dienoyl-CoA reductase-like NADH-dependent reductase (Old Yellow Enzyme family)
VEVHAAHGYLILEFLSPKTNRRTDKWGDSFENRCRFAVHVVRRIRSEEGKQFPLLFRFGAEESVPGSLSVVEGLAYAKILEKEGVECFDVTHGDYGSLGVDPEVALQRRPKRIVVAGAGPGGLEFSIRAAEMGDNVTVLEKRKKIGCLLRTASLTG